MAVTPPSCGIIVYKWATSVVMNDVAGVRYLTDHFSTFFINWTPFGMVVSHANRSNRGLNNQSNRLDIAMVRDLRPDMIVLMVFSIYVVSVRNKGGLIQPLLF